LIIIRGIIIRIRNKKKTSRRNIKATDFEESKEKASEEDVAEMEEETTEVAEEAITEMSEAGEEMEEPEEIKVSAQTEESQIQEEEIFVLPGDFVGTTEEFAPGPRTYLSGGEIYSTATGKVSVDRKKRVVSVIPTTSIPPIIKEGDIVVGEIVNVRESMVLVELAAIKGAADREMQKSGAAAIHVSNVKEAYVKDISREFALFDIVKARVIDTQNMRLTTSDDSLGVMKAICSNCKAVLVKENNRLKCPSCGRKEGRKMSSDYGTGIV
jgi:exosome complex component CSL4